MFLAHERAGTGSADEIPLVQELLVGAQYRQPRDAKVGRETSAWTESAARAAGGRREWRGAVRHEIWRKIGTPMLRSSGRCIGAEVAMLT